MTRRPQLRLGSHLLPGIIAIAVFGVFLAMIAVSEFDFPDAGFPTDESVVQNIGFALLNIDAGAIPADGFLVPLLTVAVVLDAALGGAIMLATRDEDEGGEA